MNLKTSMIFWIICCGYVFFWFKICCGYFLFWRRWQKLPIRKIRKREERRVVCLHITECISPKSLTSTYYLNEGYKWEYIINFPGWIKLCGEKNQLPFQNARTTKFWITDLDLINIQFTCFISTLLNYFPTHVEFEGIATNLLIHGFSIHFHWFFHDLKYLCYGFFGNQEETFNKDPWLVLNRLKFLLLRTNKFFNLIERCCWDLLERIIWILGWQLVNIGMYVNLIMLYHPS